MSPGQAGDLGFVLSEEAGALPGSPSAPGEELMVTGLGLCWPRAPGGTP